MTPVIEIVRLETSSEGTFGVLKLNKVVTCVTLEPPNVFNTQDLSCIPASQYLCIKVGSRYGLTLRVCDVPNRTGILFHAGNQVTDTQGCIILGQSFGKLRGNRAVLNSGKTFKDFINSLADYQGCHLTIKEAY